MGYNKRGNPFKRGKSWTFYYYMPDRRLRYKGGYLTHAEAKEEKERISALVTLGMFVPEERLSVAEFMVNWYETSCYPGLAHNSRSGYTNALYNYVLPYMGTQKLQNITRATIKGLYKAVCAKSPHVARIVKTIMNTCT